jgi:hypothetical protein
LRSRIQNGGGQEYYDSPHSHMLTQPAWWNCQDMLSSSKRASGRQCYSN